jgi:ferrous iron transport protein B
MATPSLTIALAGNPNCGKSTIFNSLTGARQHVGNWPGKTVEKKEGRFSFAGHDFAIVDLPGTYSLNAFSAEESIARNFIMQNRPSVVVSVVDSANLERNLYLAIQLLELGAPLVLALNMADVAENRHIRIDGEKLSRRLGGIPVIPMIGNKEVGLEELKTAIVATSQRDAAAPLRIKMGQELESEIDQITALIEQDTQLANQFLPRWLAIKLLEADEELCQKVSHNTALTAAVEAATQRIENATGEDPESLVADHRYGFIGDAVHGAVHRPKTDSATGTDRIDRILTHHTWGLPIFLVIMWVMFQVTANVSTPYLDWVDSVIAGPVTGWGNAVIESLGLGDTWVQALIVDGVIAGVGGVLVFVPVLVFLYVAIAILEDTGYMARAAFVMDRFMQKLGLHGKSFLPMLVGFGCNVPAIYATRTLENELDRKITGFLTTFMSCGARLPIYVIFGTAFFGASSGTLVFAMYAIGILVAILTSLILTRLIFRNKPAPLFVMELPPYRFPNIHNVMLPVWHRLKEFLRNAGTVIFAASVFIWFLLATPIPGTDAGFNNVSMEDSLFGAASRLIAPALKPAGFDSWEASGALVTGFVAKEAVIATLNQLYIDDYTEEESGTTTFGEDLQGVATGFVEATILTLQETVNILPRTANIIPGINVPMADFLGSSKEDPQDSALENALRNAFSPLAAVAFNVFVLLYVPCMATTAAMYHEFGTRWMMFQIAYTIGVAWLVATLVYQTGTLLGFG